MFKLFYTRSMQPVQHGDVVHFGNRAWTIDEINESDSYLKTKVWVRSMDEQHLCLSASPMDFMARWVQVR